MINLLLGFATSLFLTGCSKEMDFLLKDPSKNTSKIFYV